MGLALYLARVRSNEVLGRTSLWLAVRGLRLAALLFLGSMSGSAEANVIRWEPDAAYNVRAGIWRYMTCADLGGRHSYLDLDALGTAMEFRSHSLQAMRTRLLASGR
jgi:hypothetical protein